MGVKVTIKKNKERITLHHGDVLLGTIQVAESNPTTKIDLDISLDKSIKIWREKFNQEEDETYWNNEKFNK